MTPHEHDLTLAPEIDLLRGLLRRIGSDDAAERDHATLEAIGMSRVIAVIARSVEIEQRLRAGDVADSGSEYRSIIAHVLDLLDRPRPDVTEATDADATAPYGLDGEQVAPVTEAADGSVRPPEPARESATGT